MSIQTRLRALCARIAPLTAAAVLTLATPAQAEFMGGGFLTDYQGCQRYGWPVNTEMVRARYSAQEIDGGPSQLVLSFAVGGINTYLVRAGLAPSNTWHRAPGTVIWGTADNTTTARLRVLERESVPFIGATFDEHVENVRLRVRIRNFNGMQGCTVTAVLMFNDWNNTINRS